MELREHQVIALGKLHNGAVLNGGVGSGKTITALAYFVTRVCGGSLYRDVEMTTPHQLVVITTARKRNDRDWQSHALEYGIFDDPESSYGGCGIVVDSWNNIDKYKDREGTFFIFDEQKVVGSGPWAKAFIAICRENPWILLSATPADTWMDYVPIFIANGFYRNRTDFIENHVIWSFHGRYRKVKGFYGARVLRHHRAAVLVEMPFTRETRRIVVPVNVEHDVDAFKRVWMGRWNVFDDCPLLDSGEKHRVARRLVNSDIRRLDMVSEVLDKHNRVIIFYNFDYELELLRTLHTSLDVEVAEYNGHRHEAVPTSDRWLYLVQYVAGAEAWDCITTDCILFYSLTYSHKVYEQAQGRIDRMNTPYKDLFYYVFKSKSQIDKLIWRALSTKKDFHEGRTVRY